MTIDVTVLDNRRRPVRGLTAADFTIVDGDERVPVSALTEINLPPVRARSLDAVSTLPPDVATNDVAEGRLLAILFGYTIVAGAPTRSARRIARQVLEQMGPADRAAVLFSHSIPGQSFTTDRTQLLAAIDHPSLGTSLVQPMGDRPVPDAGLCHCGVCSFDAITRVAQAVMDVPERRKVLLFIGGFIPMNEASLTPSPGGTDCVPPVVLAMREMLHATQRANLTVYAFDPNGVVTPPEYSAAVGSRRGARPAQMVARSPEALLSLADHTGGRAFMNTNAPEMRVEDVLVETGSYYLLGFTRQPGGTAGEFRRVRVEVNRRGLEVRARRGYYVPDREMPADASPASVSDRLHAALEGLLPKSTLRMQLNAFPIARAGGSPIVGMVVGIEPSPAGAVRQLLAGVFDGNGQEVGRANLRVESAPTHATAATVAMDDVFLHLELPQPGQYHVRVAVDDGDTGRVASVYDIIDVPDFERAPVSLSGLLVFTESGRARTVSASGPFPQAPATRRTFAQAERVAASIQVVQRRDSPVASMPVSVRVFDAEGAARFERAETLASDAFDTARQAMYSFVLPTDALETGAYTLVVEATQGRARVARSASFQIE